MTKDEALRMAIDALCRAWDTEEYWKTMTSALQACKEALAETQEPFDVVQDSKGNLVPLYTTPPSREWVGLSDAEITHIGMSCQSLHQVARAIDKALREKNND